MINIIHEKASEYRERGKILRKLDLETSTLIPISFPWGQFNRFSPLYISMSDQAASGKKTGTIEGEHQVGTKIRENRSGEFQLNCSLNFRPSYRCYISFWLMD